MSNKQRLKSILDKSFRESVKTSWWLTKMMVAITFVVTILKWTGWLTAVSVFLEPVLVHVGLSVEGTLAFLTGMFTNLYSAIAVMVSFGLGIRMVTILSVMGLVCHNLIIETAVQYKTGSNIFKIAILRISTAIILAAILNKILPEDLTGTVLLQMEHNTATTLWAYISDWLLQMCKIIPYMWIVIFLLNLLQEVLRAYDLVKYISTPLKPLIRFFGLNEDCAFLWVVLNTLGLTYGSSVMLSCKDDIPKQHLQLLNTHAAITHSLLEDTLIFVAIGVSAIWLIFPRLIFSFIAVWSERLYIRLFRHTKNA